MIIQNVNYNLILIHRYTDNEMNTFKYLATKYQSSLKKERCHSQNNDLESVQDYIYNELSVPVVSLHL